MNSKCTGNKISFATKKDGDRYIRDLKTSNTLKVKRGGGDIKKLKMYKCLFCDNFHMTSKTKKQVKINMKTLRRKG